MLTIIILTFVNTIPALFFLHVQDIEELEMWANDQRDARPAEYRWRPLFNATKFG